MPTTTFLPLLGLVAITLGARAIPWHRLPPGAALWTITGLSAASALSVSVAAAAVSGGFLLGTEAGQALVGGCSLFVGHHRVPAAVGVLATFVVCAFVWRAGAVLAMVRPERVACREKLTVLDVQAPIAFARSGRKGGIVVSAGMLAALAPAERRVLFAHERAHMRGRHDLHLFVHRLAAGVLPWLDAVEADLRLASERVADAAALAEVNGDRRLVATAIARAARAVDQHHVASPVPAFTGGAVGYRIQSLLHPVAGASAPVWATGAVGFVAALTSAVFAHHLLMVLEHICLS